MTETASDLRLLPNAPEPPIGLQRWVGGQGRREHPRLRLYGVGSAVPHAGDRIQKRRGCGRSRRPSPLIPSWRTWCRRHGVVRQYVYDYGNGAVNVGDVDEDGTVRLT